MSITIEHEIGEWELGEALAEDSTDAGVALLAMAVKVGKMPPDEVDAFIGEVRYQILKKSNTASIKDLYRAVRVIEKIADGLSK